ncbi:MAG: DUF6120 family protein [Clostridium sp.]|nr:DUF6120 family protein [Clostridium sp.]MCM1399507.1 DUF6120 family protein [Clostridium sp.]MCM1460061.1 DUF6120 family protein [Bacteroides sp.]
MNNKAVKKYIWRIKKALPFVYNNRKRVIRDIRSEIMEYAKDKKYCTYEELVAVFGKPEDIVNEYMSETISRREFVKLQVCYIMFSTIAVIVCVFTLIVCNLTRDENVKDNNFSDMKVAESDGGFQTKLYENYGGVSHEIIPSKEKSNEGFHTKIYEVNGDSTCEIIMH